MSDPKPTILDRVLDRPGLRLILWVAICHAFLQSATMQPNRVGTYHDAHYFCLHEEAARITILEHGQVPVWNPWFCGGIPGIANPQDTSLAPDFLLRLAFGTAPGRHLVLFLFLLLGLEGSYRFARAKGLTALGAALAAAAFACSGRITNGINVGQLNMLGFELLPWAMLGFELGLKRWGYRILGGFAMAWMLLYGGTYTVPYTGLVLGLLMLGAIWRLWRAGVKQAWRAPLVSITTIAAVGIGLSAIRLIPMLEVIFQNPRIWERQEANSLVWLFSALASPRGTPGMHIAGDAYVGPWILALAIVCPLLIWRSRPLARTGLGLLSMGGLFFWMALGDQGPLSIYSWMNHLPIFGQLRDPYRYTILVGLFACLAAGCTLSLIERAAGGWGAWVLTRLRIIKAHSREKSGAHLRSYGLLLALPIAVLVSADVVYENRVSASVFSDPPIRTRAGEFRQSVGNRWDAHLWPAIKRGSLQCFEETPFAQSAALRGNLAQEEFAQDPDSGTVERKHWSPQRIELKVTAKQAMTVVVNQNHHRAWTSTIGSVRSVDGLLGLDLPAGDHRVVLSYEDPLLNIGLYISLSTLVGLLGWVGWTARRKRRKTSPTADPNLPVDGSDQAEAESSSNCR